MTSATPLAICTSRRLKRLSCGPRTSSTLSSDRNTHVSVPGNSISREHTRQFFNKFVKERLPSTRWPGFFAEFSPFFCKFVITISVVSPWVLVMRRPYAENLRTCVLINAVPISNSTGRFSATRSPKYIVASPILFLNFTTPVTWRAVLAAKLTEYLSTSSARLYHLRGNHDFLVELGLKPVSQMTRRHFVSAAPSLKETLTL